MDSPAPNVQAYPETPPRKSSFSLLQHGADRPPASPPARRLDEQPESSRYGLGIRAILYCVFDETQGRIIKHSDPPNAVAKSVFDEIVVYLLPDIWASGKVISVIEDRRTLLGAPVFIQDGTRYKRNCFQFNVCLVVSSNLDLQPYHDVAHHLAASFRVLEVESRTLSQNSQQLVPVLRDLRAQLNMYGECCVRAGESHAISFRIRRLSHLLPPEPELDKVPVPLCDLSVLLQPCGAGEDRGLRIPVWTPELVVAAVVPWINAVRTVAEIVDKSGVEQSAVLSVLCHLVHVGFVAIIDRIDLANKYRLNGQKYHRAIDSQSFREEVVSYVTVGRREYDESLVQEIIYLYSQVNKADSVKDPALADFAKRHRDALKQFQISLRSFVMYGLLQGILEPVENTLSFTSARRPPDRESVAVSCEVHE